MQRTFSAALITICVAITGASYFWPELLFFAANRSYPSLETTIPEILFYQFLHGGILHLVSNAIFILYFGPSIEQLMGMRNYVLFFLCNTLFVYVALILFAQWPTIGISGFCMALLAYAALELSRRRDPQAQSAFFMLGINVLIGFTGSISLVGHASWAIFWGLWYLAMRKK